MRVVKFLVVLALLGGLGWYVYNHLAERFAKPAADPHAMAAAGPMPVTVLTVQETEKNIWQEYSGVAAAVDTAEIRPRVGGTINEIYFESGAIVKKGDKLFLIDPQPYQVAVNQAQAALSAARAQQQLAQTQSARAERLIAEKAIAQRDFDERRNGLNVSRANVQAAAAALEQAKLNLDYATITAPFDGKISRAEITVGNLVDSGANAPVLATLVSYDPIYVTFDIDEATYLSLHEAMHDQDTETGPVDLPVEAHLASSDAQVFPGKIESFDNKLNPSAGTLRARAIVENKDNLLVPGMFTKVRLGSATTQKVVLVPDDVIGTDQDRRFVYLVDAANKIEVRPVTLGPVMDHQRVIASGLKPGEKIVTTGLQRLRPGADVVPTEQQATEQKPEEKPE